MNRSTISKGIKFLVKNKRLPSVYEVMRHFNLRREKMPLPRFAQVEITTKCNFTCTTCSRQSLSKTRLNRDMTVDEFNLILQALPLLEVKLQGLGEPFLCRDLPRILEVCRRRKIRVTTITNGSCLPDKDVLAGIDSVTISFDASGKKAFEIYRKGADFEKILGNIAHMLEIKKVNGLRTKIGLLMVVTHLNFEDMEGVMERALELGVDFMNFVEVENWYIPSQSEYKEFSEFMVKTRTLAEKIKNKVESFRLRYREIPIYFLDSRKRKGGCFWPFFATFITVDGYVTPCCIRMDPEVFNFGNVYEMSFPLIWNSERYVTFRRCHLQGLSNPVCDNCPD